MKTSNKQIPHGNTFLKQSTRFAIGFLGSLALASFFLTMTQIQGKESKGPTQKERVEEWVPVQP